MGDKLAMGAVEIREVYKAPYTVSFPGMLLKMLPELVKYSWTTTQRTFVCFNKATDGRTRIFMVFIVEVSLTRLRLAFGSQHGGVTDLFVPRCRV
jgi:hypothetical protein